MSDPQQLDRELREYLEKEPNLRREDRLIFLKSIFHKHLEFTKLDHVVNNRDLFDIISTAKSEYSKLNLPLHISKKRVEATDLAHVAMITSIVGYLNRMSLLKKTVKFDTD